MYRSKLCTSSITPIKIPSTFCRANSTEFFSLICYFFSIFPMLDTRPPNNCINVLQTLMCAEPFSCFIYFTIRPIHFNPATMCYWKLGQHRNGEWKKITKYSRLSKRAKIFFYFFGRYFSINIFYFFLLLHVRLSSRLFWDVSRRQEASKWEQQQPFDTSCCSNFYCSTIFLFYFIWSVFPSCYFLCCFLFVSSNNNRRSKGQNERERERWRRNEGNV